MSTWTRGAIALARRDERPTDRPTMTGAAPTRRAPQTSAEALGRAIALLDAGRPTAADAALTAALVADAHNADLWLAAGVARLRRGAISAARSAFEMCAWISGDTLARELAGLL
jgi:Tfp pilus assembly protein PilF